jgi:hypothetical protein
VLYNDNSTLNEFFKTETEEEIIGPEPGRYVKMEMFGERDIWWGIEYVYVIVQHERYKEFRRICPSFIPVRRLIDPEGKVYFEVYFRIRR